MITNSPNVETIVETVGLTKIFRDFWMRTKATAVDGISFQINRGELLVSLAQTVPAKAQPLN